MSNESQTTNYVQDFLKQNALNLIGILVSFAVAFSIFQAKIEANAQEIEELKITTKEQQVLLERIIVLEERQKTNIDNIMEIKADVKDIKNHFSIPK